MAKIDPSLYLQNKPAEKRTGNSNLGKDEFLKILMAQLQNQDPLNPMEDKDFIAQMATFSSLEQMTKMASSFEKFMQMQQSSQMVSYHSFVGKEVTWHKIIPSEDAQEKPAVQEGSGTVASIRYKGDGVEFTLSDGTVLEPANISEVKGGASGGSSLVESSHLIGHSVSWNKDGKELSANVRSVSSKEGAIWLHLDNGDKILPSSLTKIEK